MKTMKTENLFLIIPAETANLREGKNLTGDAADDLTNRLRAARAAFVKASVAELLRLLSELIA